jgi:hypothetical protein
LAASLNSTGASFRIAASDLWLKVTARKERGPPTCCASDLTTGSSANLQTASEDSCGAITGLGLTAWSGPTLLERGVLVAVAKTETTIAVNEHRTKNATANPCPDLAQDRIEGPFFITRTSVRTAHFLYFWLDGFEQLGGLRNSPSVGEVTTTRLEF